MQRIITLCLILILSIGPLMAKTIYVAKNGSDISPGSKELPYATIGKAATQLFAGDTLYIREGRYAEYLQLPRSGSSGNPIVILAYPGEKVVLSALEPLSGWELDEGSVYKTTVGWDLGQRNFVMHGDTACDLARWPNNTDGEVFTLNSLRNTGGSSSEVASNAYLDYSHGIPDYDWSKGGSVFFYGDKGGAGWIAWKSFVKSNSSTRLTFDLHKNPDWIRTWHAPADLGDFFLEGIREAIDYQNEWYFNENTKVLYLQLPGGVQPADSAVYMRKRIYTIRLNQSHIVVKNLEVFGGSIEITGSNNHLYGIKSRWGNHHRGIMSGFSAGEQSFLVQGSYNVIEKCDIGFGAATGVKLSGNYNTLTNSMVHNFNFLGSYDAPVMARDGGSSTLSHNTISRGGRDAVHMSNDNSVMSYNDVSRSNLIADDCGLFYCTGGPHNITIHHNWFHDTWGRGKLKKAAGIYLDSSPKGFTVHHNVVWNTEWSSVQMNRDARDINIYNNTFWDVSSAIGVWHADGTHFERVVVYNNLSNNSSWDNQTDYQNNLTVSSNPFVNSSAKDWQLKPETQPINFGREIKGITDGYTGSHPDAGAYEFGAPKWRAGIDWDPKLGPDVCLEEDVYEEVDGVVVIEAESAATFGQGWKVSNDLPAHGDAYLEYMGPDEIAKPQDSTLTTYKVKISHPGTYRIQLLSRNGTGAIDPNEQNSSWIHMECDNYFGLADGVRHELDTAFSAFSVQDLNNWSWEGEAEFMGVKNLKLYATFTYSGIYTLSLAGRSSGHLIDRLALYQEGRQAIATDSLAKESPNGCDQYTIKNPWATPIQAKVYHDSSELMVDGVMDSQWEILPAQTITHSLSEDLPSREDLSGTFRLSFNDSALFLYASIQDDVLSKESLDLFVNPDNSHRSLGVYGEDAIHMRLFYGEDDSISVGNGDWKASDFSGFKSSTRDTIGGYILEARIPWKGIFPMEFTDNSTTYMGFELQLNDADGEGIPIKKLAWANNTGMDLSMYDTRKFGSLALIKNLDLLPVRVTGVEIAGDTIEVGLAEIVRLEARVLPEDADNQTVTWHSSDPFIIYLDPSGGVVKGLYPGTAVITATTQEGGFVDSSLVVVPDPNATGLKEWDVTGPKSGEISLFPNPASTNFRVEGVEECSELKIFSVTGELVLHHRDLDLREQIQIESLAEGLYLVSILSGDKIHLKKLLRE